jgi:hypothetical protein
MDELNEAIEHVKKFLSEAKNKKTESVYENFFTSC